MKIVLGAFGFCLVCGLWGAILGAAIGLIGGLIPQAWRRVFRSSRWGAIHRPVRLSGKEQATAASGAAARSGFRLRLPLACIPTLLVLAIAFGIGIYVWRIVNHRLADAIAVADGDDPYWRLDDLIAHREVVPDAENSALVVARVVALLPESWPAASRLQVGTAAPSTELMKAYERMQAAADNVRLDDETIETLRRDLKANGEAVKIARTIAGYRRGRYELKLGLDLDDTPVAHLEGARRVAQLDDRGRGDPGPRW